MKVQDLDFNYPENLIAQAPVHPPRVMWVGADGKPEEISFQNLLANIPARDVLVVNNTKVLRRRVFANDVEVLFLKELEPSVWQVLFPSKKFKVGESLQLPEGVMMKLIQKGRPQVVQVSQRLDEAYFLRVAELPLPPYIQKARDERHNLPDDERWYQTAWAHKPGSFAAPTASLHFSDQEIGTLKSRGVQVLEVTLHVGLGTFLPVTREDLNDHDMHEEFAEISAQTWQTLQKARSEGRKVWALGTTSARTLESAAGDLLTRQVDGSYSGLTKLLIQPGYHFKIVDRLLTNFHQPQSTLLALVAAFSTLENVKACYQWAIDRKFRLFSYGDLSCWMGINR